MGMGTDQPGSTTSKTSFAPLGITFVANSGDAAAPDRHVADTADVPPEPLSGHFVVSRVCAGAHVEMIAPFFARVNNPTLLVRSASQMTARSLQMKS
jgi:hypothetical protein